MTIWKSSWVLALTKAGLYLPGSFFRLYQQLVHNTYSVSMVSNGIYTLAKIPLNMNGTPVSSRFLEERGYFIVSSMFHWCPPLSH